MERETQRKIERSASIAQRKVGHAFDLRKTFACGQCFRWNAANDSNPVRYIGVVRGTVLELTKETRGVHIAQYGDAPLPDEFLDSYFDFGTSYPKVRQEILSHAKSIGDLAAIQATNYCKGMRLLVQDPFETLVSFMISANNNIPKIKQTIRDLCEKLGDPIASLDGEVYYTFPTPEQFARNPDIVKNAKAIGYRDRGIVELSQKIISGSFDVNRCLAANTNYETALKELVGLYGVGEKVANCVLLFGLGHRNAFPVDTWVKKVLAQFYGVEKKCQDFIQKQFPVHAGLLQQYLFFYLREKQLGKKK